MNNYSEQFSQIYDEYIGKIYRFVYLKVNSRETAEDITSKVFLKGWETHKDNGGIEKPRAFLYQVARNMVTDYYRTKDKAQPVSLESLPHVIDRANVHENAAINADIEAVRAALTKIKQEYQDVILWHYLDDMPVAEIAEIVGKPAGTVRVMLHRGLKNLKEVLEA